MRQNPCRYCRLSSEYKGRRYPSYTKECIECDNLRKHKKYLKSKRKYEKGEKISGFSELMEQTYIFCDYLERPLHIETIKSWQVRIVLNNLESGSFYKAINKRKEE